MTEKPKTKVRDELDALNRSAVTIPAADWEKFRAWLNRPARNIPKLREPGRMIDVKRNFPDET